MKLFFSLIAILTLQLLSAQSFTEISQDLPFDGIDRSSIAFSDVDGDDDLDVLITGRNTLNEKIAKLYINDGSGKFSLSNSNSFEGVYFGSVAFSDVDGDNDPDVLITGSNRLRKETTKLYLNDGSGIFTIANDNAFTGVYLGSIAFADVDGDDDPDLLVTGLDNSSHRTANLYVNDGLGSFSLVNGTPFRRVDLSSIAFADVDGDNDPDVLITGRNILDQRIAKLYINDGDGRFNLLNDTPFEGVAAGSVAFADVDGDEDLDVLITGGVNGGQAIAKLYTNYGRGNFTLSDGSSFEGVQYGSVAFADVDDDGDPDALIAGQNSVYELTANLYTNDGSGGFTRAPDSFFEGVQRGSIAFADVDSDGDQDVLFTGRNNGDQRITKLYTNNGMISSAPTLSSPSSLDFVVSPNPLVGGQLKVRCTVKKRESLVVNIFDLNGQLLQRYNKWAGIGEQVFTIDISAFPKGNYLLQLVHAERTGVQKIVIP